MEADRERKVCTNCRKAKIKCDGTMPCGRCQRLDLICLAQSRKRGRPSKQDERDESVNARPSSRFLQKGTWHSVIGSFLFGLRDGLMDALRMIATQAAYQDEKNLPDIYTDTGNDIMDGNHCEGGTTNIDQRG